MKKYVVFLLLIQLLNAGTAVAQDGRETRIFEPAAMQQDFNYLRKTLEDTHPGLYKHHTKAEMHHIFDSLFGLLNKPMAFFDFYRIIAYTVAEVKCEHTFCNPYKDDYNKRVSQWKLFPMQLQFWNNKAYVVVNRTADTSIHLGDEVLFINHFPIDSIKRVLYKYMPADGDMESSRERALSSYLFSVYYHLFIEQPDAFDITFKDTNGQIFERSFNRSLSLSEANRLAVANPANREILDIDRRQKKKNKFPKIPMRLELEKEKNTAFLYIREFGGDRIQFFKKYEEIFTKLKAEGTANLVVYLADNGGGDEEYACELLSYLIDKPTRFIENEYLVNVDDAYLKMSNLPAEIAENKTAFIDTVYDGKYFVKPLTKYSMELKEFQPKEQGFKGHVYFWVNGATSSAASACAANAKSHQLATIAGDETAGSYAGGGTTNGLDILLPNSKITVRSSIVYCSFSTIGGDKNRGVIPDHYFKPDFSGSLNNTRNNVEDWKEFIYKLIENRK